MNKNGDSTKQAWPTLAALFDEYEPKIRAVFERIASESGLTGDKADAGSLFAGATAHAFSGLGVDYGDDDQPILVARRSNGEQVAVAGLSEGTRDQLFLALRLALLARRPSEPVPFIADDLLTSFDETRTLATLSLLAAAGQKHQVILFTHHWLQSSPHRYPML